MIKTCLHHIKSRYYQKQRKYDVDILWLAIKNQSPNDINHAKAAFALHCFHDSAWLYLGNDEISKQIGELQ